MVVINALNGKIQVSFEDIPEFHIDYVYKIVSNSGYRKYGRCDFLIGTEECLINLINNLKNETIEFHVTAEAKDFLRTSIQECNAKNVETIQRIEDLEERGGFKLWKYQFDNVLKMVEARSSLNCGSPGTGKTLQALCTLPEGSRTICCCPKAAMPTWRTETLRRRPDLTPVFLKGTQSFRLPEVGELLIISYDSLPPLKSEMVKNSINIDDICRRNKDPIWVIGDEVHYTKSFKTARTKRFRSMVNHLMKTGGNCIGLTGTPIMNKLVDLWCIMQNCNLTKETFGSWDNYVRLMGGSKDRRGIYSWDSSARHYSVPDILAKCVIRNTLEESFPDMPSKIHEPILLDLEDSVTKSNLDAVWSEVKDLPPEELLRYLSNTNFTNLTRIRERMASLKIEYATEIVKEFEEYGEPLIVASCFKKPIEKIGSRPGWRMITGDVSTEDRSEIQAELEEGKLKGVALTIRAAGISMNLQTASNMLLIDRDYTVASMDQITGRIMRIGQTRPCYYKYLIFDHPLERRVTEILDEKQALNDLAIETIKESPQRGIRKSQLLTELLESL
jgi:SWI/SNF-related matrix-associated actin-dependent regulator of chromatin subfamily A-like protein 1